LVIGFYWMKPWTDDELAKLVASEFGKNYRYYGKITAKPLLEALGEPGKAQLEFLKQKKSFQRNATEIKNKKIGKKSLK
jgi:hypothetical protein